MSAATREDEAEFHKIHTATPAEFRKMIDDARAKKTALLEHLGEKPFEAKVSWGWVFAHRDAREPGKPWRLSFFGSDKKPNGHTNFGSYRELVDDLSAYGVKDAGQIKTGGWSLNNPRRSSREVGLEKMAALKYQPARAKEKAARAEILARGLESSLKGAAGAAALLLASPRYGGARGKDLLESIAWETFENYSPGDDEYARQIGIDVGRDLVSGGATLAEYQRMFGDVPNVSPHELAGLMRSSDAAFPDPHVRAMYLNNAVEWAKRHLTQVGRLWMHNMATVLREYPRSLRGGEEAAASKTSRQEVAAAAKKQSAAEALAELKAERALKTRPRLLTDKAAAKKRAASMDLDVLPYESGEAEARPVALDVADPARGSWWVVSIPGADRMRIEQHEGAPKGVRGGLTYATEEGAYRSARRMGLPVEVDPLLEERVNRGEEILIEMAQADLPGMLRHRAMGLAARVLDDKQARKIRTDPSATTLLEVVNFLDRHGGNYSGDLRRDLKLLAKDMQAPSGFSERDREAMHASERGRTLELDNPSLAPSQVYIATLLNPCDRKPYAVIWNADDGHVYIVTPSTKPHQGQVWADGYFEDDPSDSMGALAASGCPRTHTPGGTRGRKGVGLGLMLYCGLALTAAYSYALTNLKRGKLRLPEVNASEGCVSSYAEGRSAAATKWWEAQVKNGLATEETVEGNGEEDCDDDSYAVDIDAEDVGVDQESVEAHVLGGRNYDDKTIKDYSVSGDYTVNYTICTPGSGEIAYQKLTADSVDEAGFIIDLNPEISTSGKNSPPIELFREIDLSDIKDHGFIKLIEDVFIETSKAEGKYDSAVDFQRFLRERVPFYMANKGEVAQRAAGPYAGYQRNPKAYSAAWLKRFGRFVATEASLGAAMESSMGAEAKRPLALAANPGRDAALASLRAERIQKNPSPPPHRTTALSAHRMAAAIAGNLRGAGVLADVEKRFSVSIAPENLIDCGGSACVWASKNHVVKVTSDASDAEAALAIRELQHGSVAAIRSSILDHLVDVIEVCKVARADLPDAGSKDPAFDAMMRSKAKFYWIIVAELLRALTPAEVEAIRYFWKNRHEYQTEKAMAERYGGGKLPVRDDLQHQHPKVDFGDAPERAHAAWLAIVRLSQDHDIRLWMDAHAANWGVGRDGKIKLLDFGLGGVPARFAHVMEPCDWTKAPVSP